jgi:hypothetical protein
MYVCRVIIRINSDYFPKYLVIGLCNGDELCSCDIGSEYSVVFEADIPVAISNPSGLKSLGVESYLKLSLPCGM